MSKKENFDPYPERPVVSGTPTAEELQALDEWTRRVRVAQGMPLGLDQPYAGEGSGAPEPK